MLLALPGAQALLAQGVDRDKLLIESADRGDAPEVARLLADGASPKAAEPSGATALIAAAYRNQLDAATLLLAAGADVNARDNTGQSAFLIAVANGNLDFVKMTMRNGANLDSRDSGNATALIRAARYAHNAIIIELLRAGAELNQVTRAGRTALTEAIVMGDGGPGHTDTVRMLVRSGTDLSIRDNAGLTPLQHARQREFREISAILVSAGGR